MDWTFWLTVCVTIPLGLCALLFVWRNRHLW